MSTPLITALGASAGGIQALKEFFEHAPSDAGIVYVVLLHLSPNHDSRLAQVLQHSTAMPVRQVTEKTRMEPDHVYVIPPDKHLILEDDHIIPAPNRTIEERRAPVDIFFRHLADTHGSRAVGVLLSGTGANGSMGLKRIKEYGGAVYVQNPREAEFNEMPRNAIATGLVDAVLNVADIPVHILAYRDTLDHTRLPAEKEPQNTDGQQALKEIFLQLRQRTGHDFSNYKRATLMRRIGRRMAVHNRAHIEAYAAYCAEHPEETQALLKDLLISVTNFFRDKTPFEYVETHILPQLFAGRNGADQVRIWVAGCATGEEAYTLAMLCAERALGVIDAPRVQIFATDIDEAAIVHAREGYYSLNDAADVSPERLARFFVREGEGYRIRREIRETILFAHHNFLKDPPFSHIDLISCRNVLIYLNRTAQKRVMDTFHFALKPKGFLLLGTSESPDGASNLFSVYDREQHVYQSQPTQRPVVVPESVPDLRLPVVVAPAAVAAAPPPAQRLPYGELHLQLLEQYAPPSLVVNADFNIVHASPGAGRYLRLAGGEPTQAALQLIRDEARTELRNALYQAAQKGLPVNSQPVQVRTDEGPESIRIHVRPVTGGAQRVGGFLLVVFEPVAAEGASGEPVIYASGEDATRHLEDEVARLRAQLRASNEQHEFQAEELKAGNEELQAMNEEIRSAVEELETSKEELQSINEELSTVNQELKVKVEEATLVSDNLQNLINSTDIGTIFLDRSLRVVLFTPAARTVFNLISADFGRPLSDITGKLLHYDVSEDARQVLDQLQRIEREATTTDDRHLLIRLSPYRTEDDRIQGVVVSLLDITERKQAEQKLREAEEKYRNKLEAEVAQRTAELAESKDLLQATMDSSVDMIQVFEAVRNEAGDIVDFIWILNNHAAEKNFGDVRGQRLLALNPGVVEAGIFEVFKKVTETGEPDQSEHHYAHEQFDGWYLQSTVKLGDGVATTTVDITSIKKAELELLRVKEELAQKATDKYESLFNSVDDGFTLIELLYDEAGKPVDFIYQETNPAFARHVGSDFKGRRRSELSLDKGEFVLEQYARLAQTGEPLHFEYVVHKLGDQWFQATVSRIGGEGSRLLGVVFRNVTERKEQERQQAFLLRLSDALRTEKDADAVANSALQMLLEYLQLDRSYITSYYLDEDRAQLDYQTGNDTVPPLPDYFVLSQYPKALEATKEGTLVINDELERQDLSEEEKSASGKLGMRAMVAATLRKDKDKPVWSMIAISSRPRRWTRWEIALVEETAERTWAAMERAKAEAALRQSEEKYRTLFETIDDAFCIIELLYNEEGIPVDFRFLEANPAYQKQTGLMDVAGRLGSEVIPGTEFSWFSVWDKVLKTGEGVNYENWHQSTARWYQSSISRIGISNYLAIVGADITERKNREQQQDYLLQLSDALRLLTDPIDIQNTATRLLGEYVQAERAQYVDVDEKQGDWVVRGSYRRAGAAPLSGIGRLEDFEWVSEEQRQGKTIVIADAATDKNLKQRERDSLEAIQVRALLSVPLLKNGKWVATLSLHHATPHPWSEAEITLVRETAERTWSAVERARAETVLRESESRIRTITDAVPQIIWTNEADGSAVYFNERWYEYTGLTYEESRGPGWQAIVHPEDAPASKERWQEALAAGKSFDAEYRLRGKDGSYRWFIGRNVPLRNEQGVIISWFGSATDIQELKATEEALRESEERLSITMESAVDYSIINMDTAGITQGWSRGAERIFEWTEAEMLGKSADIIFTPEDRAAGAPQQEREMAIREGFALDERWHIRKDGSRFFMSGVMRPIYDGALRGFVKVARDLTEERQAEEQLRINEERYRIALQSAEMGAWDWNIPENRVAWNEQHFLLLGLEPEAGRVLDVAFFLQFIHPEDTAAVTQELQQAVEESGVYRMEAFRIIRADNSEVRWMSGYGRSVVWQDDKSARMVGVMYDITETVEANRLLREKQLRLDIAQKAARVGIWGYDLAKEQGLATPEWNELTGYPNPGETFELETFFELVYPDDRAHLRSAQHQMIKGEGMAEVEFRLQHPQRGLLWLLKRGQYIPPYGNQNATLMGSLIDITERKLFEQQKEQFIGIASHELRTPVTSIKAYVEILAEMLAESGDSPKKALIQKLDTQVARLTSLIYMLLDTTRIAEGALQLHKTRFGIDELITETAENLQPVAGKQQIELQLKAGVKILADPERIRQVVVNLIGNALKYAPNADRIVVSSRVTEGQVTVCVQDFGIGIPEQAQQLIFERFFREKSSGSSSGLGLGLYISAGIVQQHGGRIWVESKPGEGALFCFTLPVEGGEAEGRLK